MGDILDYKILIVDDDPSIHEVVECALIEDSHMTGINLESIRTELFELEETIVEDDSINYIFDHAYQGEEALIKIDDAHDKGNPYSLAIVDSRMPPGIDGPTAIEKVFDKYDNIDILFCTAYSDISWQELKGRVKYKGNFAFIKKPFDIYIFRQFVFMFAYKRKLLSKMGSHI